MSKSRARDIGNIDMATALVAYSHMHPPKDRDQYYRWLEKRRYKEVSQESVQMAEAAIEWASNLEGEEISEYLHNIRVIARRGVVSYREQGLGASIVAAYQRHLNTLRKMELAAKRADISQYVGQVGERRIFKLFVEKVIQFERQGYGYGNTYTVVHMHVMSDKEGNQFTWWSSSGALETGKEVTLKGTIKAQEEYVPRKAAPGTKGVKQNVLSRCEVVELKNYMVFVEGNRYEFEAIGEKEVRVMLRERLGVGKLPRGLQIVEMKPEVVILPVGNENELSVSL
jgi:hypothetical protein